MIYKRVLLKLSGEALKSDDNSIDEKKLEHYIQEIKSITEKWIQVAIVIWWGNIYRGSCSKYDKVWWDRMWMLATYINWLAIKSGIENSWAKAKLFTAIKIEPIWEYYNRDNVVKSLEDGYICILSWWTWNPFFTTDTGWSLRAIEIKADVLLKWTKVDGIYDSDPKKNPNANKFDTITFDETYKRWLNVMDMTAITLCKENNLPLIVFDINKKWNLLKIVSGEKIWTKVNK